MQRRTDGGAIDVLTSAAHRMNRTPSNASAWSPAPNYQREQENDLNAVSLSQARFLAVWLLTSRGAKTLSSQRATSTWVYSRAGHRPLRRILKREMQRGQAGMLPKRHHAAQKASGS
jgi:hypothetical protein